MNYFEQEKKTYMQVFFLLKISEDLRAGLKYLRALLLKLYKALLALKESETLNGIY